ncbi:SCO family protein [Rubeoparvulum massiliense]|uniref:SCO family protein n=1 Tax=Rubeoparvulum massiliense TaxID=1631346 RepID=UPI00069DB43B|nr:SCO family protein [Rubeoparvulum massiliense]
MRNFRWRGRSSLLILLILLIMTTACSPEGSTIPQTERLNWEVLDSPFTDLTFIDHNNSPFSLHDLEGTVWITDLVFTTCNTVCPPMTANMQKLQQMLIEEDLPVKIISFSVNPTVDTPELLKEYGELFQADLSTWYWVTGYRDEEITQLAKEVFQTVVALDPNSDQVIHGTRFYLVDKSGKIVKYYDGINPPYEEMMKDIRGLVAE